MQVASDMTPPLTHPWHFIARQIASLEVVGASPALGVTSFMPSALQLCVRGHILTKSEIVLVMMPRGAGLPALFETA